MSGRGGDMKPPGPDPRQYEIGARRHAA